MSAETFLQLAEQGGFLEAKVASKLRNHLAGSSKTVTPAELAELLVSRKVLSADQSAHLLNATQAADAGELQLEDDFNLRPARRKADTRKSLDLLDVEKDDDLPLLSAEPVLGSTGFRQDGSPADDSPTSVSDSTPLPGLTPPSSDYGPSSNLGLEEFVDADFNVNRPTGVLAVLRQMFQRNQYKGQRWDSSLMMMGGGGLLLLILVGGALYYVLATGSGDEYFEQAEEDYKAQLYTQAIQKYDRFIDRYPRHTKVSLARVRVGLAHMRREVESADWDAALQTAQVRIDQIRPEEEFPTARPELAGILPTIYDGFVAAADDAEMADNKESLLSQASQAHALITNPDYLPASQRRQIQSRVDRIDQRIEKVRRDIQQQREVAATIEQINQSVAAGDSATAYRLRDELLERYPGAQKNPQFQAAVMKVTGAEQQSVRVSDEKVMAATSERAAPGRQLSVTLTARKPGSAPALEGRVIYTLARGGLYAIDGASGKVLWRRWLGFQSYTPPATLGNRRGTDVVAVDHRHGDLICCAANSGQLKWRTDIGRTQNAPVIWDDHLLQVNNAGKLFWVNAADGSIQRTASFPQSLTSPPGVDRQDHLLFQPGNHSTLYVLDADTFQCVQTVFIGHSDGTITVAPTITKDHVLVIENGATDYCRLHVFARQTQGQIRKVGKPLRLSGIVVDSPITNGRNVLVATDRGAIYVLESDPGNLREPVRVFAQVHPRNERTSDHFGRLSGDRIFVSGTGLSEYEINAARGEMTRKWTEHLEDVHLAAPELVGDTLITRRRSAAGGDVIVEAAQIPPAQAAGDVPRPLWTTRIAATPAGAPVVSESATQFLVTARNGSMWNVDKASFRERIVERALTAAPTPVASVINTKAGTVFTSADDRAIWQFAPAGAERVKTVKLDAVQNRLATPPVGFADGLLVCTTGGPIYYAAAESGELLGKPFQLPMRRDANLVWLPPAIEGSTAWVASDDGLIQRLEPSSGGLTSTRSSDLKIGLAGQSAVAGKALFLVARSRKEDTLIAVSADSLEVMDRVPTESRLTAGPVAMGDVVMLVTADGHWLAVGVGTDGKLQRIWRQEFPLGTLAGDPVMHGQKWICAAQSGEVFQIDPANGNVLPWTGTARWLPLGEPLGSGVAILDRLLLVAGSGGTLHAAQLPEPSP